MELKSAKTIHMENLDRKQVDISTQLKRPLTIYIPAYNCSKTIVSVITQIPNDIAKSADILVVDNASSDNTFELLLQAKKEGKIPEHTILIKAAQNLGYAGSQKLAYSIARLSAHTKWVAMLHGDGQYSPTLLEVLKPYLNDQHHLVYGYRSKSQYSQQEETPFLPWMIIKVLSLLESLITGYFRKEWHSGFVMYHTDFLRLINLKALTTTPHFDGHMLFASGLLKSKVKAVPIFKRYRELDAFEGHARRQYVLDVFKLMFNFRKTRPEMIKSTSVEPYPKEQIAEVSWQEA